MRSKRFLAVIASFALIALVAPAGQVAARQKQSHRKVGQDLLIGVDDSALLKAHKAQLAKLRARAIKHNRRITASGGYQKGDRLYWPAWDDTLDFPPYLKKYKLRGTSPHMELWVAAGKAKVADVTTIGTQYPAGDCRNDYPERIKVTNAQVNYFVDQFETNMYPTETALFSTPPNRNGSNADATLIVGKPKKNYGIGANYWKGKGQRIVTLVDNVRDDQFYDMDDSQDLSRIGGFFSTYLNDATDRNVMTIDSWNWIYGTTGTPPNDPVPGDVCASATADPFGYEGTFAHEFQHLLESYADADGEDSWIDEGMAEYAAYATGYVEPSAPMTDSRWHGFIQCFLGNVHQQTEFNPNPHEDCGPENSLTWWGDQDADNEFEILADYGAAFSLQLMLAEEYGEDAITFLHNHPADGLEGLQALLDNESAGVTAREKIHQWALMVLLDGLIDDGATVTGGTAADYQVDSLNMHMDLTREDAYAWPGSPPNGSDYVAARDGSGNFLSAADIDSITFAGDQEFPADPMEWTEDATGDEMGGAALAATDTGPEFDGTIARTVTVPADNATLTFDTKYDTEAEWDFFFVQVSADGGDTWTSLANEHTTSAFADGAYPTVQANVPGLTGTSGGGAPGSPEWVTETFDLSAYAGQEIVISFRYVTDWAFEGLGTWVDNVAVGGTTVSAGDDLEAWETQTQVNADDIEGGFTVQLVSYDASGAMIGQLPVDENFQGSLSGAALDAVIGTSEGTTVVALVMYDEDTEAVLRYAPYTLTVNGVTQPGGR